MANRCGGHSLNVDWNNICLYEIRIVVVDRRWEERVRRLFSFGHVRDASGDVYSVSSSAVLQPNKGMVSTLLTQLKVIRYMIEHVWIHVRLKWEVDS